MILLDKEGPLGEVNNTTYYNGMHRSSRTVNRASTSLGKQHLIIKSTTTPLTTFFCDEGDEVFAANANESITEGAIRAYLLDSSDNLIADDNSVTKCR